MIALLRSRLWLILLGIGCELLYVGYLLRNFPLIHYFNRLTSIASMTHYSSTGLFTFFIIFTLLFMLFLFAWWQASAFQDRLTLWLILGFGSIFAATTSFVSPITSLDLFTYIARGLVWIQHHGNPMTTPPAHYAAKDPLMKLANDWISFASPYGPFGIFLQALPVVIAKRNVFLCLLLYKLIFSSMIIVCAFLVYQILKVIAPQFALSGALALAWNPFVLLEYSVNGHNDIAIMLLVLLAVFALLKERPVWAMVLIIAANLVKIAALPLIPLFLISSIVRQSRWEERIRSTIDALAISAALVIGSYAPFWEGWKTFSRLAKQAQTSTRSFNVFLRNISFKHISLSQGQFIGLTLFAACFLFALKRSAKDFPSLVKSCFLTMFTFLLFGTNYFQVWYLIWPVIFAVLVPQTEILLATFLLTYAGTLTGLIPVYGRHHHLPISPAVLDGITFVGTLFPPICLFLILRLRGSK